MSAATDLARFYDDHMSRLWRDGAGVPAIEQGWLEQWWVADCTDEPSEPPMATSALAAGGAGIRWRESGGDVVGYVPARRNGCYRIPRVAATALLKSTGARSSAR